MFESIKYNLANLANFSGRDGRPTFWWWVLAVVVFNFIVSFAVSIPMTASAVSAGFDAAQSGNEAGAQDAIRERVGGMAVTLVWVGIGMSLLNLVLVGASFVRRLRDAGQPVFWALIAGVLQIVSVVLAFTQMGETEEMMRRAMAAGSQQEALAMQGEMAWQSRIGWLPLVIVAIFGVFKSRGEASGV